MLSASEQPALSDGISTVRVGLRIFAVSAMNLTPQKTITSRSVSAALRLRSSESPTKSGTEWKSGRLHVVVAQDDRVALDFELIDLVGQLGLDAQLEVGGVVAQLRFQLTIDILDRHVAAVAGIKCAHGCSSF